MIVLVKENGITKHGICEFIVDREEEIASLPVYPEVSFGSSAMVKGGKVFMLFGDDNAYVEL